MTQRNIIFLMLPVVFCMQSCTNSDSNSAGNDNNTVEKVEKVNENNKTIKEDDSEFMVKAASGGMMEVELGRMAQEKAKDQRVKEFGAMMVQDHTKANEQLKALAANKNIALPTSLSDAHRKSVSRLSETAAEKFDKAYISFMVDDHKEDIDDFDKASRNATDADIKALATKTLPVLRSHLEAAKAINDKQ